MLFPILILLVAIHVMRKCASSFDIAASYLTRGLGEGIKGPTINAIALIVGPFKIGRAHV